jgi:hypothetical protein
VSDLGLDQIDRLVEQRADDAYALAGDGAAPGVVEEEGLQECGAEAALGAPVFGLLWVGGLAERWR